MTEKPTAQQDATTEVAHFLRQTQRRLVAQRVLDGAVMGALVAFCLFALLLVADRFLWPALASWPTFAGVLAGSTVLGALWAVLKAPDSLTTAKEVDRRLRLKERIASACHAHAPLRSNASNNADRKTEAWAQLVVDDAAGSLAKKSVAESFPVRMPRRAAWALGPAALCLVLGLWLPSYPLFSKEDDAAAANEQLKKEIAKKKDELKKKLEELKKRAEENRSDEAKKLLELLAKKPEKSSTTDTPSGDKNDPGKGDKNDSEQPKKDALVDLTDKENAIKEKLKGDQFKSLKSLSEKLKGLSLKNLKLSKKLQAALKKGDLKAAKDALKKLQDKLNKLNKKQQQGQLTKEEKAQMQKLSEELARLARQLDNMSGLGAQMANASSSLSGLNMQNALQALQNASQEMDQLSKLAMEMEFMKQALQLVQISKQQLAQMQMCKKCGKPQLGQQKPGGT